MLMTHQARPRRELARRVVLHSVAEHFTALEQLQIIVLRRCKFGCLFYNLDPHFLHGVHVYTYSVWSPLPIRRYHFRDRQPPWYGGDEPVVAHLRSPFCTAEKLPMKFTPPTSFAARPWLKATGTKLPGSAQLSAYDIGKATDMRLLTMVCRNSRLWSRRS